MCKLNHFHYDALSSLDELERQPYSAHFLPLQKNESNLTNKNGEYIKDCAEMQTPWGTPQRCRRTGEIHYFKKREREKERKNERCNLRYVEHRSSQPEFWPNYCLSAVFG